MSSPTYDVLIIGAGIVGAACALEAVEAKLRTAVVEASVVGGGATAAGMGHLVVLDDSEAQFALSRYSQLLWQELALQLPKESEYVTCGSIWAAADAEEMVEVERKAKFYSDRGIDVEILDAHMLAALEPNLRPGLAGGLRVPGESIVYPPVAAQFLIERACAQGAKLYLGHAVKTITEHGVILDDNSALTARKIVNATGAGASLLTPGLEIFKRKGHLAITDRYPGFVHHQVAELGYLKSAHSQTSDSVAFNVQPRPTGQILIGSSRQYGIEYSQVDTPILARMLARAADYLPGLASLSVIQIWTGFRAATPDKLPLIGPCPGYENLYLATGHEGLGISTSLGTAKLLIDQLIGRSSAIPIEPYLPARTKLQTEHV